MSITNLRRQLGHLNTADVAILIVAILLRTVMLGSKPPHFDEGVNGWFVDQMTANGYYHYDPTNYHGPLHFYILFLAQTLFGRHIEALRLPIVCISVVTVWLVLRFDRFLSRRACQLAALAMAISPAAVFYGRYAIHESFLVFFLILITFGLAGLWKYGTKEYLWATFCGAAGAVLTKETCVVHFACLFLALVSLRLLKQLRPSADAAPITKQQWTRTDLALCCAVNIALVIFFYSGAMLDWSSLKGLTKALHAWFKTGKEGHGHQKAWYYWLTLIGRYEWPVCLGMISATLCFLPKTPRFLRYLLIYGAGCLTAYSIAHYKTPWCIISLIWPFFFSFGYLADRLITSSAYVVPVAFGALLAASVSETIWLNFRDYTNPKEPYVYVQTLPDVFKLTKPLKQLAASDPSYYHITGNIIVASYHPLPWMLGDFTGIGYYDEEKVPSTMDADFLLVEPSRVEEVKKALHKSYFTEPLHLREAQDTLTLYLNARTFQSIFPGRQPDLVGDL